MNNTHTTGPVQCLVVMPGGASAQGRCCGGVTLYPPPSLHDPGRGKEEEGESFERRLGEERENIDLKEPSICIKLCNIKPSHILNGPASLPNFPLRREVIFFFRRISLGFSPLIV